jgi:tubulin polyglutamylase TTLL5
MPGSFPSLEEIYDLSEEQLSILEVKLTSIIKLYEEELNINPEVNIKQFKEKMNLGISYKKALNMLSFTTTELKSRNCFNDIFDYFLQEDSWNSIYTRYFEGDLNVKDDVSNSSSNDKNVDCNLSHELNAVRDVDKKDNGNIYSAPEKEQCDYSSLWNRKPKGKKMHNWMSEVLKRTKVENGDKMIVGASALPPLKPRNIETEISNKNHNNVRTINQNDRSPINKNNKGFLSCKDKPIKLKSKHDSNNNEKKLGSVKNVTKIEKMEIIVDKSDFDKNKVLVNKKLSSDKKVQSNLQEKESNNKDKILEKKPSKLDLKEKDIKHNKNNQLKTKENVNSSSFSGTIPINENNSNTTINSNSNNITSNFVNTIIINDDHNPNLDIKACSNGFTQHKSIANSLTNSKNLELNNDSNEFEVNFNANLSNHNILLNDQNSIVKESTEKSDETSENIVENLNKCETKNKDICFLIETKEVTTFSITGKNNLDSERNHLIYKDVPNKEISRNEVSETFTYNSNNKDLIKLKKDETIEINGNYTKIEERVDKSNKEYSNLQISQSKNKELIDTEITHEIINEKSISKSDLLESRYSIDKGNSKSKNLLKNIDNFLNKSHENELIQNETIEKNIKLSNHPKKSKSKINPKKSINEFKGNLVKEESIITEEKDDNEMTINNTDKIIPEHTNTREQAKEIIPLGKENDRIVVDNTRNLKVEASSNAFDMHKTNTNFRKQSESIFIATKQNEKRSKSSKIPLYNKILNQTNLIDYTKHFSCFQEIFSGYYLHNDPKNFDYLNTMRELHRNFRSLIYYEFNDNSEFDKINKYAVEAEAEVIKGRLKRVSDRLLSNNNNFEYSEEQFFIFKKLIELDKKEYGRKYDENEKNNKMFFRVVLSKPEIYDIMCYTLGLKPEWRELPHGLNLGLSWNLLWTYSTPKIEFKSLLSFQKVNHFINNRNLSRKDLLKRSIDRVRKMNSKLHKVFDILPSTFILAKDYVEFVEEFSREKKRSLKENIWIVKPVGKSRGQGIFLINDLTQVPLADGFLVQKYLTNPLLLDGYKFDLRIYVVVTSFNPLEAFIYEDGFARMSNLPFTNENIGNKLVHLTNAAIQNKVAKKSDTCEKIFGGSKISLELLKQKFLRKGIDFKYIWSQTKEIILKSLVCCQYDIPYCPSCFELFGYDIIIDSDMKCWLLEINTSPSLERTNVLDDDIKLNLVNDILTLVEPINYDRDALVNILERRIQQETKVSIKSNSETYLYSPTIQMNIDLNKIFRGCVPRSYGEPVTKCKKFEMIAPSKESENLIKMSGGQKFFGRLKQNNTNSNIPQGK